MPQYGRGADVSFVGVDCWGTDENKTPWGAGRFAESEGIEGGVQSLSGEIKIITKQNSKIEKEVKK